jgi:Protein of unknown function (DUF4230)
MQRRGFLTLLALLTLAGLVFYAQNQTVRQPDVTAIASGALQSLRAENKLIVFSASLTVMATGKTKPDALLQQKVVLVQPVLVHYGVDLSKVQPQQIRYDATTKRLFLSLPDVTIVARDIDPVTKEEVSNSGMIGKLSGTEAALRKAAEAKISPEIMKQAHNETILNLARESAKRQLRSLIGGALTATGQTIDVVVQVGPLPGS